MEPPLPRRTSLWFEQWSSESVKQAAAEAGGFLITGFGMQPPAFGGPGLDRLDIVLTVHGISDFGAEDAHASERGAAPGQALADGFPAAVGDAPLGNRQAIAAVNPAGARSIQHRDSVGYR